MNILVLYHFKQSSLHHLSVSNTFLNTLRYNPGISLCELINNLSITKCLIGCKQRNYLCPCTVCVAYVVSPDQTENKNVRSRDFVAFLPSV